VQNATINHSLDDAVLVIKDLLYKAYLGYEEGREDKLWKKENLKWII
jgi:hypothetical protein